MQSGVTKKLSPLLDFSSLMIKSALVTALPQKLTHLKE